MINEQAAGAQDQSTMTNATSHIKPTAAKAKSATRLNKKDKTAYNGEKTGTIDPVEQERSKKRDATCYVTSSDFKRPTDAWHDIDEDIKATIRGYISMDRKGTGNDSPTVLIRKTKLKVKNPLVVQDWIKVFQGSLAPRTNVQAKIRELGLNLASTTPRYFGKADWKGNMDCLRAISVEHIAWAAAQQLFGAVWVGYIPKNVFDITEERRKISSKGLRYVALGPQRMEGFSQVEINGDGNSLEAQVDKGVTIVNGQCKDYPTVEEWKVAFISSFENNAGFSDGDAKFLKCMALRLAATDPEEAFLEFFNEEGFLPANHITIAWSAAYEIMGSTWTKEAKARIESGDLGSSDEESTSTVEPMCTSVNDTQDEMSVDGIQTENEIVDTDKDLLNQDKAAAPQEADDKEMTISDRSNQSGERLISSPPKKKKRVQIEASPKHSVYKGHAESISQDTPRKSNQTDPKTVPSGIKRYYKPQEFFLNKPKSNRARKDVALLSNTLHGRKNVTFVKIKLPGVWTRPFVEADSEISEKFGILLEMIFAIDDKAILLPWNPNAKVKGISSKMSNVNIDNRGTALMYCDNLFITVNRPSWIRIRIAHDCSVEEWDDADHKTEFKTKDMFLGVDRLQVQKTACAGWLLGSHQSMDPRTLEESLKNHPLLSGLQLEARWQGIKLKNKSKIPNDQIIKAFHIHTDYATIARVKTVLNRIYGTSNGNKQYPLGKVMRFVPQVSDTRFPVSPKALANASRCVLRQKVFLSKMVPINSYVISSLDYQLPMHRITLREACMRISHPDRESGKSMFVSVDEIYPGAVSFLVHKDLEQVAQSIIATLPVVMLAWYGDAAIDWFRDDVEELMDGYYWDEVDCMVKCRHDSDVDNDIYQDFDDDEVSLHDEYKGKKVLVENFCIEMLEATSSQQQYHDSGRTVASFRSACVTPTLRDGVRISALSGDIDDTSEDSLANQFADLTTIRKGKSKPTDSMDQPDNSDIETGIPTRERKGHSKSGIDSVDKAGCESGTGQPKDKDTPPSPIIQVNHAEPTPSTITADSTIAMQQFLTNNPKAFQQFLEKNPSIIDQYIRNGATTPKDAPTEITLPSTVTPSTEKNGRAPQVGGDKP